MVIGFTVDRDSGVSTEIFSTGGVTVLLCYCVTVLLSYCMPLCLLLVSDVGHSINLAVALGGQ